MQSTKHFLKYLFALCAFLIIGSAAPAQAVQKRQFSAIIIDANTGRILHSQNAYAYAYPASLTKMMTLYLTFDALYTRRITLQDQIVVSSHAASMEPSKLYLKPGSTISVQDAIMALVTKSANDAATALAEHVGGSEAKFAKMMTATARKLGMRQTSFRNATGLPDRHQYSSARDMAVLGMALIKHFPEEYKLFDATSFTYNNRTYKNHNNLLKTYAGTDGIKTGYIRDAGFNLVASVVRKNRRLVGVIFGGKSSRARDNHLEALFDKAFAAIEAKPALAARPRNTRLRVDMTNYIPQGARIAYARRNTANRINVASLPRPQLKPTPPVAQNIATETAPQPEQETTIAATAAAQSPIKTAEETTVSNVAIAAVAPAKKSLIDTGMLAQIKTENTTAAPTKPKISKPLLISAAMAEEVDDRALTLARALNISTEAETPEHAIDTPETPQIAAPKIIAAVTQSKPSQASPTDAAPQLQLASLGMKVVDVITPPKLASRAHQGHAVQATVIPAPKPKTEASQKTPKKWAVQVGAFANKTSAKNAATKAKGAIKRMISKGQPLTKRKGKFYRAQIVGLSKIEAQQACRMLKGKGTDCLTIRSDAT